MAEELNTQQPAASGSKTNLLIIGAIVLLLVAGGVVFSQRNAQTSSVGSEVTPPEGATTELMAPAPDSQDAILVEGQMRAGDPAPGSSPVVGMEATSEMTAMDSEVRTIELEAGAFYYKPETITVKKGETVKIVMTSKDMMHDFVIDELGVKLPVTQSGETNTVEFTATQAGTFEYYCSVGQHRAQGQVGTLIVEE